MILPILFFVIGLLLLIKSADWLVDGASALAAKFKVSPLMIGLTVVAFGTSAPELVVSITSALQGNTGIAFGNIVGSNIANILLILGASAIVYPLSVGRDTIWKEVPMSFLGAFVLLILGFQNILDVSKFSGFFNSDAVTGVLTFSNGIILLSFFVIFLYYTFGIAKTSGEDTPTVPKMKLPKSIAFILGGLLGLVVGSTLLVDNAIIFAKAFGVSDQFIGLTLVAVGTSIPELVTSITAAFKKQVELAVGNVVGSNIFNIFLILGVTSLVSDIPITAQGLMDIFILFIATAILFISFFVMKKRTVGKIEGSFMLLTYISYISYLVVRQ